MITTLSERYENIYQLNVNLLDKIRQGQWDEFIELAQVYIFQLSNLIENQHGEMAPDEKEKVAALLTRLIENEDEINKSLEKRLGVLKNELQTLNSGKKCRQAYASKFISAIH
ncbi:flagellar protein FliT [Pantoea sp.]|uniref:flagellar protein FliT n=1 Tax=Pantoea sp. TaxID=69393 RepID=UPI002899AC7A|nr:flagellar protein FliT [Pantoea sp.]